MDAVWTEDRLFHSANMLDPLLLLSRAATHTKHHFLHGYYGPSFDVDQHAIFGPPAAVTERLHEHIAAGISHLMLGVPTLDLEHLRRVAEQVAPALRL